MQPGVFKRLLTSRFLLNRMLFYRTIFLHNLANNSLYKMALLSIYTCIYSYQKNSKNEIFLLKIISTISAENDTTCPAACLRCLHCRDTHRVVLP